MMKGEDSVDLHSLRPGAHRSGGRRTAAEADAEDAEYHSGMSEGEFDLPDGQEPEESDHERDLEQVCLFVSVRECNVNVM